MEKLYITRMNAGRPGTPDGDKIVEQRHTRGEIISRAEELLRKQLGQDLSDYADLEEVGIRGKVGETTMYGYVDKSGNKVDFTETRKLQAAIAVLNVNGHFFEASPVD